MKDLIARQEGLVEGDRVMMALLEVTIENNKLLTKLVENSIVKEPVIAKVETIEETPKKATPKPKATRKKADK